MIPRSVAEAPPKPIARLKVLPAQAIEEITSVFGLSLREIAPILGTSERTAEQWTVTDRLPRKQQLGRLAEFWALKEAVQAVFPEEKDAQIWLSTPNRSLGGIKPIVIVRGGDFEAVDQAIGKLRAGSFV